MYWELLPQIGWWTGSVWNEKVIEPALDGRFASRYQLYQAALNAGIYDRGIFESIPGFFNAVVYGEPIKSLTNTESTDRGSDRSDNDRESRDFALFTSAQVLQDPNGQSVGRNTFVTDRPTLDPDNGIGGVGQPPTEEPPTEEPPTEEPPTEEPPTEEPPTEEPPTEEPPTEEPPTEEPPTEEPPTEEPPTEEPPTGGLPTCDEATLGYLTRVNLKM